MEKSNFVHVYVCMCVCVGLPALREATEKGLKILRPEKKSQIFEKKIS